LQAVAVRPNRRVLRGQVSHELLDKLLRAYAIAELREGGLDLPPDVTPVRTGRAKFGRLRAFVAVRLHDAYGGDARVAERQDDVAGRDLAHGLVEVIAIAEVDGFLRDWRAGQGLMEVAPQVGVTGCALA